MKLVLAEKPSVAKSLAKVLLAKILSNPVLHLHREYCKLGFHSNRGCNTLFFIIFHSKYFSGIWMKTCFDFQFDCGWIFALKTAKIGGR